MLPRLQRRCVVAIAAAMLLSACTPATDSETGANADDVGRRTITVARTPNLSDSTVAIAQQAGWFDDAGLEVTVIDGQGTTDVVPMLLSGEVDVVYGGFSAALARSLAEGFGARAVATVATTDAAECDSFGLVMTPAARDRFDLTDPDDLRRLRIGGPFASGFVSLWLVDRLAAEAGLTLDELDLRPVLTSEAAATLAGDGVDLLVVGEPSLTRLRQTLDVELVRSSSDLIPGLAITGLFFGPDLLADEDLAASYLAIHLRALVRHSEGATDRNVAALTASTGLESDLLRATCWKPMDGATRPYVTAVESAFAFARSEGRLDVSPTPEQLWDHSVGDRARALLESQGIALDG